MIHCKAVAHPDHVELDRYASSRVDPVFDLLRDRLEVHMTGNQLVEGIRHSDERAAEIAAIYAQGAQE